MLSGIARVLVAARSSALAPTSAGVPASNPASLSLLVALWRSGDLNCEYVVKNSLPLYLAVAGPPKVLNHIILLSVE